MTPLNWTSNSAVLGLGMQTAPSGIIRFSCLYAVMIQPVSHHPVAHVALPYGLNPILHQQNPTLLPRQHSIPLLQHHPPGLQPQTGNLRMRGRHRRLMPSLLLLLHHPPPCHLLLLSVGGSWVGGSPPSG